MLHTTMVAGANMMDKRLQHIYNDADLMTKWKAKHEHEQKSRNAVTTNKMQLKTSPLRQQRK